MLTLMNETLIAQNDLIRRISFRIRPCATRWA